MLSQDLFGMVDQRLYPILGAFVAMVLLLFMYLIVMRLWEARSAASRGGLTLSEYIRKLDGEQEELL
jgi:uncharacterized membrane protein